MDLVVKSAADLAQEAALRWRRGFVTALCLCTMALLVWGMTLVLGHHGWSAAPVLFLVIYLVGLPWTLLGFWNSVIGFAILRLVRDPAGYTNPAMRDVPRESVTVALHVCRGISRSRWYTEGGYESIAEELFPRLDVDAFLLEYDSDRAGGFEPLRLVPRGKTVVLGLVTTKEAKLESQDELRRRIDEAARFVPLENLALSPQCGFASVAAGNLLSIDDQWRKLELVVGTARKVWGQA